MRAQQESSSSRPIAVVGVGNILLSDEGVGVHAARGLKERSLPPYVRVFELGTRGLEILETIEEFEKVVFIDAVRFGASPGSVGRWHVGKVIDGSPPSMVSLHQMDLLTTLKIGRATAKLPDDVVIIGIEPKVLTPGLELSSEVRAKFDELLNSVLKECSAPG